MVGMVKRSARRFLRSGRRTVRAGARVPERAASSHPPDGGQGCPTRAGTLLNATLRVPCCWRTGQRPHVRV